MKLAISKERRHRFGTPNHEVIMAPTIHSNGSKKAHNLVSNKTTAKVTKPTSTKLTRSAKAVKSSQKQALLNMGNEVSQDPATGSRLVQLKTKTKLGTVSAEYISHPGSDGSKCDENTSKYISSPYIQSTEPFTLERTTIVSGPYQGYQALVLVPVPKRQFRFQDLPTEIRLVVYHHLLVMDGSAIQIQGSTAGKQRGYEVWHMNNRDDGMDPTYVRPRKRRSTIKVNAGILSTCRWTFGEAAPILYGHNEFNVDNTRALANFLKTIGDCKGFLRNIRVNEWYATPYSVISQAGRFLAKMNDFKCLIANTQRPPKADMITALEPFFARLQQQGKTVEEVSNMFQLYRQKFCLWHPCTTGQATQDHCNDCCAIEEIRKGDMQKCKAIVTELLDKCAETEERKRAEAKNHEEAVPAPISRRDTGRPRRQGFSDRNISYAEVDEDGDDMGME